uniref:Uncharacterized protein n=1 Tax=Pipistrellus kuhlii TaxID=59472 RepID=A0A7J7YXB0_PIPKU|nr:hypothetical protein mPipKuh1_009873 [Pipistrellus kuhlii]
MAAPNVVKDGCLHMDTRWPAGKGSCGKLGVTRLTEGSWGKPGQQERAFGGRGTQACRGGQLGGPRPAREINLGEGDQASRGGQLGGSRLQRRTVGSQQFWIVRGMSNHPFRPDLSGMGPKQAVEHPSRGPTLERVQAGEHPTTTPPCTNFMYWASSVIYSMCCQVLDHQHLGNQATRTALAKNNWQGKPFNINLAERILRNNILHFFPL